MNVLLKGVVGSTAYGLNHAGSDVDYLGIFAADTKEVVGLQWIQETFVTHDPDTTMHEAKKFVLLCLNGNPSVSELLWLDQYEEINDLGAELLGLRWKFLSAPRVRDAYLGYAKVQFHKLENRGDGSFSADTRKRSEKHARHLVRLVEQGFQLYTSGELVVNLRSSASGITPEDVVGISQKILTEPEWAEEYLGQAEKRFDSARTPLPEEPDADAVERWLLWVRYLNWNQEAER